MLGREVQRAERVQENPWTLRCSHQIQENPLGRWVSTQRSMYKKFNKGEQSSCGSSDDVIQNRIAQLNTLGFHWSLLPDRVMFPKKA